MTSDTETAITTELSGIIKKTGVDVPAAKSADVADQIVAAVKKSDTIALAQVESPFASTVNITQLIGVLFGLLTLFGIPVPDNIRAAILTVIIGIVAIATWVLKTFFNGKVTWQSAQI